MERCARELARLVGYVGAATVEYLYCIEQQRFYFLELNPRLQVRRPPSASRSARSARPRGPVPVLSHGTNGWAEQRPAGSRHGRIPIALLTRVAPPSRWSTP
jgi:hypothetical protein